MKKFFITLLSVIFCLSLCLFAVGCDANDNTGTGGGDTEQPEHTHVQVDTGFNSTHHCKICSCGESFDLVEHTEIKFFDAEQHWSSCACGYEISPKRDHQVSGAQQKCTVCQTTVVYDSLTLWDAINTTQSYSMHISLANDIDLTEDGWQPVVIDNGSGRSVTIDGRGYAIIGLDNSIYNETYNMTFTVKNLTFKDANVSSHLAKDGTSVASLFSTEMLRSGVGCDYTFENVHAVNCNVTSANYCAAFVAYSNGGDITVKNCTFQGNLTAGGSVGVVVGHTVGNVNVDGLEVKTGSVIKNTEDRGTDQRKAGSVMGTAAHTDDVYTGTQTISVKNVTNNGTVTNINGVANEHNTDVYGRIVQPDNSKGSCTDCRIEYAYSNT